MADKANGVVTYVAEYETHGAFMRGSDSRIVRGGRFVAESDYEQLQAKLEAAERDAARWQLVRPHLEVHHDWEEGTTRRYSWVTFKRENLPVPADPHYPTADAAIDAAIDAQRQEGKHG